MTDLEIVVRNWRITRGIPGGSHVWFDPACELVRLYRIPLLDQRRDPSEGRSLEGLEGKGDSGYLDKVVSVSASESSRVQGDEDRYEQTNILDEDDGLPF